MIHPLLRLVATKPHLLADHAQAYAGLVSEEIGRSVGGFKRRVLLSAIAVGLMAMAAIFAGVALMLWGVMPPSSIQSLWALIAVPGVPALVGVVCLLAGRTQPADTFAGLKQQVAADLAMLRDVSTA
jgi:hypothetical protein